MLNTIALLAFAAGAPDIQSSPTACPANVSPLAVQCWNSLATSTQAIDLLVGHHTTLDLSAKQLAELQQLSATLRAQREDPITRAKLNSSKPWVFPGLIRTPSEAKDRMLAILTEHQEPRALALLETAPVPGSAS